MAHPNLTNRADRKSLAMGATAALLAIPLATAASASPLDDTADTVDETVNDTSGTVEDTSGMLEDTSETEATDAAEQPSSVSPSSQPTRDVPDAVDDIVDGVLSEGGAVTPPSPEPPAPVPDTQELIEAAPAPEPPSVSDTVEGALPEAAKEPVSEATEAVPIPSDPANPTGGGGAADPAPQATEAQSLAPRTPDRLVAAGTPPFAASSTRAAVPHPRSSFSVSTSSLSRTPTSTPLLSTPLAGNLGDLADDFVSSRTPLSASSEASATPLTGGAQTSPDAPTWLLATAGGLVLLLTAGHLLHARQRSPYTVAF